MAPPLRSPLPRRLRSALAVIFRFRRAILIVLLGAFALNLIDSLSPAPPPTSPVVVATRELPVGAVLRAGDVTVVDYPSSLVPHDALATTREAEGEQLVAAIGTHTPLTVRSFVNSTLLDSLPSGRVIVAVPLSDPALRSIIDVGHVLRVMAVSSDPLGLANGIDVIADEALVVAMIDEVHDGGLLGTSSTPGSILVAVSPAEAQRIAECADQSIRAMIVG